MTYNVIFRIVGLHKNDSYQAKKGGNIVVFVKQGLLHVGSFIDALKQEKINLIGLIPSDMLSL